MKIIEKIKERRELRETKNALSVVLMNKLVEISENEIKRQELEIKVMEGTVAINESISVEEQKEFMNKLSEFMNGMKNPKFSDAFYENIQKESQRLREKKEVTSNDL